jgi:hypothetical protein
MVSLFLTAFALVLTIPLLSEIGPYFWQKTARDNSERILPPNPDYGLFGESAKTDMKTPEEIERARLWATSLLDRARAGDQSALIDAKQSGDTDSYDRVLAELVTQARSGAALLSLMSFVAQNELSVNVTLAQAAVESSCFAIR